ncbi:coenzyme PQQ biosynthesis protein PqqD [[Phormidium ambiguum] IAM M-71]|uniref:Coenzyme PQQ biosynthesis protein PqqD n=1 Tax=[Phormidium ambiguum] IAM M-71 TaxID=454136 RepID=A0A1U7I7B8_9CYAN|nr:PqqD family protein [Phormidium ambiguum]OKH32261.1 coenzyme PQQ biosynthesis protein PqqD [Phormidium ambiguum IAM M-71]
MGINFAMRVSVPEDVLIRELDGESVILNLKSERYFGLDEVGTRMWEVLSTSETIADAYQTLLSEYDVVPEQLQSDLDNLLEQLIQNGLINVSN